MGNGFEEYNNTAIGSQSLYNIYSEYLPMNNTSIGYKSLFNLGSTYNVDTSNNTAIGNNSGILYTGNNSNNITIGTNVPGITSTDRHTICLGYGNTAYTSFHTSLYDRTGNPPSSYGYLYNNNHLYYNTVTPNITSPIVEVLDETHWNAINFNLPYNRTIFFINTGNINVTLPTSIPNGLQLTLIATTPHNVDMVVSGISYTMKKTPPLYVVLVFVYYNGVWFATFDTQLSA
jgi:hypothetical protein